MTAVPRVEAADLGTLTEIGSGGQGRVYAVPVRMLDLPWPIAYKEYDAATRDQLDVDVLAEMVAHLDRFVADGQGLPDRLAWPAALVQRDGAVTGFLMRRIPEAFQARLRLPRGQTGDVLTQTQHLLNDDVFLAKRQVPAHDRWRLEFLRDTAETMDLLHQRNIFVGDVSPMNLLGSFQTRPRCFFIDCDAMRIGGRSVLPQVETTGWVAPPREERATAGSDAYKFALLAVRLFAGDQDTRDVSAIARVSGWLGDHAARGLAPDPDQRPPVADWIAVLDAAVAGASTVMPWEKVRQPRPGPPIAPPIAPPTVALRPAGLPPARHPARHPPARRPPATGWPATPHAPAGTQAWQPGPGAAPPARPVPPPRPMPMARPPSGHPQTEVGVTTAGWIAVGVLIAVIVVCLAGSIATIGFSFVRP